MNLVRYENKSVQERFKINLINKSRIIKSIVKGNLKINYWEKATNAHTSKYGFESCSPSGKIIQPTSVYIDEPNYISYLKHYKHLKLWINSNFIFLLFKLFLFTFLILIFRLYLRVENTKISVIIPTYNRENLIGKSINSVLNQTYQNFEIIVVDDGSRDNTSKVIKKIKNKRIKYIKLTQNKGGSNARNIGIKKARGKYISFQDSDDLFYPNKLEKQLQNIINKQSNLDFCKMKVFLNSTKNYTVPTESQEKSILRGKIFDELISEGNFISTQSILVETNFMKKFFFDINMPRLQDFDVILRMIPKVKISYTRNVLVDLHIQKDSISFSFEKLQKAIFILLTKKLNINAIQKQKLSNYLNRLLLKHLKIQETLNKKNYYLFNYWK